MLMIIFIVLFLVYCLVSGRLEKSVFTAPVLFTIAGLAVARFGWRDGNPVGADSFLTVAEIGLVLLLFTDASRTDLRFLARIRDLPARLLSVGMLLSIALGAALAKLVFPSLSLWEAGIIGAILAPTDAGLGQVIVESPHVPQKIRQALNVEAGLNDGLSVPFLLFFMAMAAHGGSETGLLGYLGAQLGLGVLWGLGIGLAGGWLLAAALRRGWMARSHLRLGTVALPVLCIPACDATGASMFIAAFVAGLAVQVRFKNAGRHSVEFTEEWGRILNLAVFFLFGLIVSRELGVLGWQAAVYAVLSLTLVRMVPVAVALAGTRLGPATVAFMGWFGPRGLASIVLGLVYLETSEGQSGSPVIRAAVIATVLLSIFAHGFSATPGIRAYNRALSRRPDPAVE